MLKALLQGFGPRGPKPDEAYIVGPARNMIYKYILEVTIASEVLPYSIYLVWFNAQLNVKVLY